MFTRNKRVSGAAADAIDGLAPYANQLAHDEKLRRRLIAALGAGVAARERASRQLGPLGIAVRLGSDPVLRAQVTEALQQLQKAKGRVTRRRSHTTRNVVLFLTGAGAIIAAVPGARASLRSRLRALSGDNGGTDTP